MNTWIFEFRFKSEEMKENKDKIFSKVRKLVDEHFGKCEIVFNNLDKNLTLFLTNHANLNVLLQGKEDGLLTVDVSNSKIEKSFAMKATEVFASQVRELPNVINSPRPYCCLPSIKRGRPISLYDTIGTESLIERDFDRVVFDEVSPYQHVRILHSYQYGNCLYLDNDLNLAESDLEYTRAITGSDKEDYTNKSVLILGGGDGGILHYLRDKGPSMITMIDIDQVVIDAARVHLRGICHDALDSLMGKNYEVIVDDCVKHLKAFVQEGKKFDFIINDLTAIPVSTEPVGDHWDFLRLILKLSMQVLSEKGKYFTQGNSQLRHDALAMYEKQLDKLDTPVKFSKEIVCVPSYMENWVFYTIWKDV